MRNHGTCLTPPPLRSRRMCTPDNICVTSAPHRHDFLCVDQDHPSEPAALAAVDTYTVASMHQLVQLTQRLRQHGVNVAQTFSTLAHASPFSNLSLASGAQW